MTGCVCCICGPCIPTTLSSFSRLHSGIITSFKLINIPDAAHKNPFKYDMGQAKSDAILCSPPNVKEEKVWLRETMLHYQKRLKYCNRTVTLIQQSGRYLVDNYTAEIVLTFNLRGLILKNFLKSESSCIINAVITAEMQSQISNSQQLDRYIQLLNTNLLKSL